MSQIPWELLNSGSYPRNTGFHESSCASSFGWLWLVFCRSPCTPWNNPSLSELGILTSLSWSPPYCLSLETCNCSFGNGQEEGRQPCGYSGTRLAPGSHGSPCWNVASGRRHLRGPSWWSWTVPWILLEIPGFPLPVQ